MSDIFAPDFRPQPYWWDETPPPAGEAEAARAPLPERVDVAVVGAGYTGLNAAIAAARAGATTLVLDAEAAGFGCSTRNGGQISTSVKPDFATLVRRYGRDRAAAILKEGEASRDYVGRLVAEEGIDCGFSVCGRFHGAHTPGRFEAMRRELESPHPVLDTGAYTVGRADQHAEIGTDAYYGGAVYPRVASVDPGRYHAGLLDVARRAGARIVSHCPVGGLERAAGGFRLTTARGTLFAQKVVLATNGYSGPLSPWHRRRVIPIGSYVIATEELPQAVMDEVLPTDRMLCDTRRVVYYYRPSPDRRRILFGGRVSLSETDPKKSATRLHDELIRLFPRLTGTRVSHSWVGYVAYTFDEMMHIGNDEGFHYAMGYCGSGVGMASYLGMRMGEQAAGLSQGATAFDGLAFPTRPLYTGNPWFLAPSVLAYRLLDRIGV